MRPQSAPANQIRAGELMQHMVPVAAPVAHPHKMALSPAAMLMRGTSMNVNRRKFLSGAALASAAAGTAACCGMTKTSQSPRQSPWTILSHAPPPNSWKPCAPLPTNWPRGPIRAPCVRPWNSWGSPLLAAGLVLRRGHGLGGRGCRPGAVLGAALAAYRTGQGAV